MSTITSRMATTALSLDSHERGMGLLNEVVSIQQLMLCYTDVVQTSLAWHQTCFLVIHVSHLSAASHRAVYLFVATVHVDSPVLSLNVPMSSCFLTHALSGPAFVRLSLRVRVCSPWQARARWDKSSLSEATWSQTDPLTCRAYLPHPILL